MPFVVKASDQETGIVSWLAEIDTRGFHTFATRQMAETFLTAEDAEAAISDTRQTFHTANIVFTVESERA
jgi:hypothetical protein